jgi:DNA-binding SARP family transcriptional activator
MSSFDGFDTYNEHSWEYDTQGLAGEISPGRVVAVRASSREHAVTAIDAAIAMRGYAATTLWSSTAPPVARRQRLHDLIAALAAPNLPTTSQLRGRMNRSTVRLIGYILSEAHRGGCIVIDDGAGVLNTRHGRHLIQGIAGPRACAIVVLPGSSRRRPRSALWTEYRVISGHRTAQTSIDLGTQSSDIRSGEFAAGRARAAESAARDTAPSTESGSRANVKIDVRMLGRFELDIDGATMKLLHGSIAPSILKFLLASPKMAAHRDVLLETFWPDTDPIRSRNRLQAAISSIRRMFREYSSIDVIEFHDSFYCIGEYVAITTDLDKFRVLVEHGRSCEISGDLLAAAQQYSLATRLYRGDLLAEMPFDEWTMLTRESVRLQYLDVLDRRLALAETLHRHDERIEVAQLVLRQDSCREDAHRTLMECFASNGRIHEFLRQFDRCVKTLEQELRSRPSVQTMQLYHSLRAAKAT